MMVFRLIAQHLEENEEFRRNPDCDSSLQMTIDFYKRVGFVKPWVSYYAEVDGKLVGCAAYKGRPVNGKVEIAYGTFPAVQRQGIGAEICRQLVNLSLRTDPAVVITARTLPEENYSTRILRKNGFHCLGSVNDPEDGEVWEWRWKGR